MRVLATLVFTLVLVPATRAAALPNDLVKAELLADVKTVQAGRPFTVGVMLKIKPDWHIYWMYPGDAGLPTRVKFNLPDGWKAGELKFPLPVRFDQPGGIVGYGYRDEVMLTATITPPSDLPAGQPVHLAADVSWLCCERVCVIGKAKLSKDLPTSASAESDNAELFAKWAEQLPKPVEQAKDVVKSAGSAGGSSARVEWTRPVEDVQWFPAPPESSDVRNANAKTDGNQSMLGFSLVPPPKQPGDMRFVVAYKDQDGKRRGFEFTTKVP